MNLVSRLIFACFTGMAAAGTACGPPPPEGEHPPELVEEEESETPDGTEVQRDVAAEEPRPVSVGCDPRAPGVPCCTTTLSEDLDTTTTYVPWAARLDGDELALEPMTQTTFEGHWAGVAKLGAPAELDCPIGAADAGLNCAPETAPVVETADGRRLTLVLPFDTSDIALEEGDEVELDFAEGLRVWDEHRNIVLHVYRPPAEAWNTFERVYGPLRVSLVPNADDFSTAICIADPDVDCGGLRIERLVVEGDDETALDSGQTTMPADGREFRVHHLLSARPLAAADKECADLTPPQPAYAVIELQ
jgi:hypothetical protein